MPCSICKHPERQAIDQALVAGSATLAALSQQYNLSTSALHRHKAHLQAKVSQAKDLLQDNLRQGCFFWLSQALEISMQTAQAAQAEGNSKIVLQALAQGTRLITIILKQDLHLDDRLVYEILASPQWAAQPGLLPHDPRILAAGRQALAGTFSTPCPEPGEVSPDNVDLNALQELLSTLVQPPATEPKSANRKLKTGNRPLNKREKSGKLPGKSPLPKDINKENQEVNLRYKIAGMFHPFQSTRICALETKNPKLETLLQQCHTNGKIPADKPLSEYIHEQSLRDNQDAWKAGQSQPAPLKHPGNGTPQVATHS
jgi:hypothetical protein